MSRTSASSSLPLLLLQAEPLPGAGLTRWIEAEPALARVVTTAEQLQGRPQLVIWNLSDRPDPISLRTELERLRDRWQPAPLLLLLSGPHRYSSRFLLELPVEGLLEQPDAEALRQALTVLLAGGRVVDLAPAVEEGEPTSGSVMGLGEWLLISGLQQIDAETAVCRRLLAGMAEAPLARFLLEGRLRELQAARQLLLWLWSPLAMAFTGPPRPENPPPGDGGDAESSLVLTLRQRSADGIWEALRERLQQAAGGDPDNRSGQLLALDGLRAERRSDLLIALLEQFDQLRGQLGREDLRGDLLLARWRTLQPELRRQALRRMAGSYVQLPREGSLRPVAESLLQGSELAHEDPDLPDPLAMLNPLLEARPLLVDGSLLAPDEPRALLYLEMLLANWLVRSAEMISAEVLAACAEWPELRRYLLRPELLSTRSLERLRNQLNAQERWVRWVDHPIRLYESRRPLYRLQQGEISSIDLTEPRDRELRQLPWPQQVVTLALEARDALGPQLRALVRGVGDLVVVLLTQVVGRAIGLVGRGVVQGMGRSIGRG